MYRRQVSILFAASLALASPAVGAQGLPGEIKAREAADAALGARIDELGSRIRGGTLNVDCGSGQSVAQALAAGATRIIVRGICSESVTIDRDDVTLQGEPGASIQGPDPDVNTVLVTGHRVTVEGLGVGGGRNGILGVGASNLTVRNATIQGTGRIGIVYISGSSGTIDGCIVQANARDGIVLDASYARLTNNVITGNRNGVLIVNGGNASIGLTERQAAAGNTIDQNTAAGISINLRSIASVAMNQITRNGSFGITVFQATASIVGGNTISDNAGVGVSVNGSNVVLGDTGPGLSTVNQITRNGSSGVIAFLGSTMAIRDAQIVGNTGAGVLFSTRSQGQIASTTIQSNTGDGIRLVLGSALLPLPPATSVSGNGGFGIQCADSESSVVNTDSQANPPAVTVSGNGAGQVSLSCTTFDQPVALPPVPAPGFPPGPVPPAPIPPAPIPG